MKKSSRFLGRPKTSHLNITPTKMNSNNTYEQVIKDTGSQAELRCIKAYRGDHEVSPNNFIHYEYNVGDISRRCKIILIPDNWELA